LRCHSVQDVQAAPYDKTSYLLATDSITRAQLPFDLNPAVTVDGYGSFDQSGIQNEWTAQMSLAHNTLDGGMWKWAYFLRQLGRARIDAPQGEGAGLAQAAVAHDSGFGGFRWDSSAIAPASVAWWVMSSLDFPPLPILSSTRHAPATAPLP
jgi:hypothetical protein